jgi:hypothetical protein
LVGTQAISAESVVSGVEPPHHHAFVHLNRFRRVFPFKETVF